MKRLHAGITIVICLLVAGPVGAQPPDPLRHGRKLLQQYCGQCHAVGRTDVKRGAPPLRELGRTFDLDQLERWLERGISSSHPAMPQVKFTEEDAHAAADYVRSIQK